MQEYSVILTLEAIYDIADIAHYIEIMFGLERADHFQAAMANELRSLSYMGHVFPHTQFYYRNYQIRKKLFPPSLIFYILLESQKEIHVLRVLREERNWGHLLNQMKKYTYLD